MKNKRGSHVGVVLSFVIFVTFLFFVYNILEPSMRIERDKESLLEYLKMELVREFVSNLTSISVKINKPVEDDCIILEDFLEIIDNGGGLIVKNGTGNIMMNGIENKNLKIENRKDENFFRIYYSEEFISEEASRQECVELKKEGYTIGLVRTEKYLFKTKIEEFKDRMKLNYDLIKEELKIPLGNDFGFSLTQGGKEILSTEDSETIPTNIYAREIPIQYVDKEAKIFPGFITIKVW